MPSLASRITQVRTFLNEVQTDTELSTEDRKVLFDRLSRVTSNLADAWNKALVGETQALAANADEEWPP